MTSNVKEFEIGLRKFTQETLPADVRKLRNAIALEAHRGCVMMTPVRTSRLKSNWSVTTDPKASSFDWDKRDESGNATIAEGAGVIQSVEDPWTPIAIHNGIEYAAYINDGTDRIAATHMIERTVARIRRMFQ